MQIGLNRRMGAEFCNGKTAVGGRRFAPATEYMNCFRHTDDVAVTTCKSCGKPLCAACSQQSFEGHTGVCSEACARTDEAYPDPDDLPDTPFSRAFASIYVTLLTVVVGGGLGGLICVFGAQSTAERLKHLPLHQIYYSYDYHRHDPRLSIFRIFYDLGITDWRAEFGIGAVVGIGLAGLWLKQGGKIAAAAVAVLGIALQVWAAWR
jgi:hypothetical protein